MDGSPGKQPGPAPMQMVIQGQAGGPSKPVVNKCLSLVLGHWMKLPGRRTNPQATQARFEDGAVCW